MRPTSAPRVRQSRRQSSQVSEIESRVKTRQFVDRIAEITRWPVDMETKGDADLFIFIELDLRSLSPAFLLTNAEARETQKNYMGSGNWSRRMYRVERRERARRC